MPEADSLLQVDSNASCTRASTRDIWAPSTSVPPTSLVPFIENQKGCCGVGLQSQGLAEVGRVQAHLALLAKDGLEAVLSA